MTLTQLVTDKETSQRLKELGVKQNSYAYWVKFMHEEVVLQLGLSDGSAPAVGELCEWTASAWTASELLKMLPAYYDKEETQRLVIIPHAFMDIWHAGYLYEDYSVGNDDSFITFFGDELPQNALANLLIYLIEQGIIKVEEL